MTITSKITDIYDKMDEDFKHSKSLDKYLDLAFESASDYPLITDVIMLRFKEYFDNMSDYVKKVNDKSIMEYIKLDLCYYLEKAIDADYTKLIDWITFILLKKDEIEESKEGRKAILRLGCAYECLYVINKIVLDD